MKPGSRGFTVDWHENVGVLGHLVLKGRTPKRMHIVYLAGALAIAVVLSVFALLIENDAMVRRCPSFMVP